MKKIRWKFLYITVIIVLSGVLLYNQTRMFIINNNQTMSSIGDIDLEKGYIDIHIKKIDSELIDIYINGKRYENIKTDKRANVYEGDYVYVCSRALWESNSKSEVKIVPSQNFFIQSFANGIIIKRRGG